MLELENLRALKARLEEQSEKYTHIIQMPCRIQAELLEVISDFGKLTGETFNIQEMKTDFIWCAVDWIQYIIEDIELAESEGK